MLAIDHGSVLSAYIRVCVHRDKEQCSQSTGLSSAVTSMIERWQQEGYRTKIAPVSEKLLFTHD